MKTASVTEAKNNLSSIIDGLKNGSSVLITDRGRPVARLEPVKGGGREQGEILSRLIRARVVRPRRLPVSKEFLSRSLPRTRDGSSVIDALLEERREGR